MQVSGDENIDTEIRRLATEFAEDETAELAYEVYTVDNYLSVVFHKPGLFEEEPVDELLPLVFDLTTKKQVSGSDFIKESYFAVIKERLQTYVREQFEEAENSDFITYREVYEAEDYQMFFLTEDSLVFWFAENTLLQEGQKPFSYPVSLEEAKPFLKYHLDGSKNGIPIRELDPEKPMLAFTFDDGPAFVNDLDEKIVELFLQYDGRATFFFVGDRMDGQYESYEKKAKAVFDAGFEVGSHTYSHNVNFSSTKEEKKADMWKEFNLTNLAIADGTGYAPDYIRLPGGSGGKFSLEFPMINVNWNVDSKDYQEKKKTNGAEIIADRMKEVIYQDGDILLYHSIYQTTYDALVEMLPYLDAQGYQFVTLSELFYYKGITPEYGKVYKNARKQTQ
ncbi:MAG: hypothetical protein E7260_04380 [Lachnospiraceae bacterium]|nr:hypothetical protein [Lachnospiraceae bacterium]